MRKPKLITSVIMLALLVTACTQTNESLTNSNDKTQQKEINKQNTLTETHKESGNQIQKEGTSNSGTAINQEQSAKNLNLEAVTVERVVDGDTIKLKDGRRVRLIGVNAPESTTRTEEYGKEASNYSSAKLTGKQVWLQMDVSETDRYGRLLRVLWMEIPADDMDEIEMRNKMYNADLVLNGYAEPSTYPPDVKYSEYFMKFAREARENGKGLWAFGGNGTTKGDLDNDSSSNHKNNPNSDSRDSSTNATQSFQNCTELRRVYPDGVPSDHHAYKAKHDGDKDNWACER